MKRCVPCSVPTEDTTPTCLNCGEASFVAEQVMVPEPPPIEMPAAAEPTEIAPIPVEEPLATPDVEPPQASPLPIAPPVIAAPTPPTTPAPKGSTRWQRHNR
jgi:hypothetical protein